MQLNLPAGFFNDGDGEETKWGKVQENKGLGGKKKKNMNEKEKENKDE